MQERPRSVAMVINGVKSTFQQVSERIRKAPEQHFDGPTPAESLPQLLTISSATEKETSAHQNNLSHRSFRNSPKYIQSSLSVLILLVDVSIVGLNLHEACSIVYVMTILRNLASEVQL